VSDQECLQARSTVDDTATYTPEQLLVAEQHIRTCVQCETWRNQVNAITLSAKNMPMFDVPESLTQRIMADVQIEAANKAWSVKTLVLSTLVLVASVFVFSFDSFDTIYGAFSWMIGFVLLFGLRFLIQASVKQDALLQNQN
jgi:hypothetical protein